MTTAAAAALVALAGLIGIAAVQAEANQRLRDVNQQLAASVAREQKGVEGLKAANEQIQARFALATDAIALFHGEVSRDLLLKEKAFDKLRNRLLRGATDFYRRLEGLLKARDDPDSRRALARLRGAGRSDREDRLEVGGAGGVRPGGRAAAGTGSGDESPGGTAVGAGAGPDRGGGPAGADRRQGGGRRGAG
jgi:hypothetical protein